MMRLGIAKLENSLPFASTLTFHYICRNKTTTIMKKSIFCAAMAAILPFCGYAATKTVNVGTFNAIKVNSHVNVAFTQGKSNHKATIDGKSNEIVEDVTIEVKNGTLTIDRKNKKWKSAPDINDFPTVTVASPEIHSITINGSGDFTTSDLTSTNLEININGSGSFTANGINASAATAKVNGSGEISIKSLKSTNTETDVNGSGDLSISDGCDCTAIVTNLNGSGDLYIQSIAATKVTASLSGSGDMRIFGKSDSADLKLSRSGDLDAGNLVCSTVSAKVTGSGDLTCHATESVSTDISGSGEITVKGGPKHVQSKGKKPNM